MDVSDTAAELVQSTTALVHDAGNAFERMLVLFVLGTVLIALAGPRMERLELEVAARPIRAFALGLLGMVVLVAVGITLSVTIIGIPFAVAGALVVAFATYAGICAVLRTVGAALIRHRTDNAYLHLALGCVLFLMFGAIPWLGDFVTLGLVLVGFGTVVGSRAAGIGQAPEMVTQPSDPVTSRTAHYDSPTMFRSAFPVLLLAVACNKSSSGPAPSATAEPAVSGAAAPATATLGQTAPDFELPDLEGKTVKLADYRGKVVVLEWFNPECPFVKGSHGKGSLVGTAERHTKSGVVWLAIDSGAPGKQGHGRDKNADAAKSFGMSHPVLLDESGKVGKAYGAKTTPHMYVVNAEGKLVYSGAIDNSPDGVGESPSDGKLVNYVDLALDAVRASKPVATPSSEPYGCSVKYAKN